ncbi:MAG: FtsQ-type POTRA domain-containing protein [bacterium]|nr:FtsQ-type POTRA domain-containing protein [bacterium]
MAYRKSYSPRELKRRKKKASLWAQLPAWLPQLPFMQGRKRTGPAQPLIGLAGVSQPKPPQKKFSPAKALLVFMVAVLCATAWVGVQLINTLNIFRVTDLRVSGARFITERQALELTGLRQGLNLITFSTRAAEKKIAQHPWVADAQIKKQWPSGVLVQVREFAPFAMINLETAPGEYSLRYLDYDGHVIAAVQEGASLDFPVISGAGADDIADDRLVQGGSAQGALQILHFAARGNALLPLQSVSEVRITQEKALILYLADHPFPIYFGNDRLQNKFNNLLQLLKKLYDSGEISQIAGLELTYGENPNKMLCRLQQPR